MSTIMRWVALAMMGVMLSGCGPPANPEALRQEVLKADPGFSEVLGKRDELANRIMLLERERDLKQRQVEEQITKLRKELQDVRTQVEQKIQKVKTLMKPDLDRVDLAISMANEERQAKRQQRESLSRSIGQLRKALKQGNASWTDKERVRMDRDLDDMTRETQRLDQEISALNKHLRLLKTKRLVLKL